MTDQIRALAELKAPRYTSYPTAPHFNAAITAAHYASWLSELPESAVLSLYLHVPYCANLCHYCGCHTKAVRQRDPVEAYADRLEDEVALVAGVTGSRRVGHVHWGGGTPSLLGVARIGGLVDRLTTAFDFTADCEHVFELDPRYVTPQLAATLARLGVTRVSLGVQEFAAHVQAAIGRIQPFAVVERAVLVLRESGIGRINFDLMYGLPHQTTEDIRRTVDLTASLAPQRIACFGYAHVPWFKPHQRLIDEGALPDAASRLAQADVAGIALTAHGYEAIGFDHFALPDDDLAAAARSGRLRRNFQGYTTDQSDALIGFGASAIGRLPQGFVQNAPDAGGHARAVAAGRLATVRGVALSDEDRVRAEIIERLMCDLSADPDAIAAGNEIALDFHAAREELGPLAAEGLVRVSGNHVTVTRKGRPFVRLAAAAFDAYLPRSGARHSVAV